MIFYPTCESRFYVRNAATGHRTALEPQQIFCAIKCGAANSSSISGTISSRISTVRRARSSARRASHDGVVGAPPARARPTSIRAFVPLDDVVTSTNLGIVSPAGARGNQSVPAPGTRRKATVGST